VGNPVDGAVTFASCDASKVAVGTPAAAGLWAAAVSISAVTLGESCVVATSGAMDDTIRVRIVPGSIVIAGPTTVLSGQSATYSLEFYSLDGTLLAPDPGFPIPPLQTLNPLRLPLTEVDEQNYDAAGQQPGTVAVRVATSPEYGSVTDSKVITIVPGVFAGTQSATTGEPFQDTIVVKAAAGRSFDGDEFVTIGGQVAINWTGRAADAQFTSQGDSLLFMIPVNLAPATYEVIVFNQGSNQIAEVASPITVAARSVAYTTHVNPTAVPNTAGARIENKVFPLSFPAVVTSGAAATDRSVYTISPRPAALALTATLSWIDPGDAFDIDLEWINGAFTAHLTNDGRTGANPERVARTVAATAFEFIRVFRFSGVGTMATQMVITNP
jgi:hypothetical protein